MYILCNAVLLVVFVFGCRTQGTFSCVNYLVKYLEYLYSSRQHNILSRQSSLCGRYDRDGLFHSPSSF